MCKSVVGMFNSLTMVLMLDLIFLLLDRGVANKMDEFIGQSTPEMVSHKGYPVEIHKIYDEAGYGLVLHRIPHGLNKSIVEQSRHKHTGLAIRGTNGGRRVAFLMHGAFCSSNDWVLAKGHRAFAFKLANAGYDVWMGNSAGNHYSRAHTKYGIHESKYWDFSFEDTGRYNVPAMIDYILDETNQPDLYYIGHSMGATAMYIALHYHSHYNSKIRLQIAAGPAVFLDHIRSPLRALSPIEHFLKFMKLKVPLHGELFSETVSRMVHGVASIACKRDLNGVASEQCILQSTGYDPEQLDEDMVSIILSNTPSSSSVKMLNHYLQYMENGGRFCRYDYGKAENIRRYGRLYPPEYDLYRTTIPVAIYYGANDLFCVPSDVRKLAVYLPNVVSLEEIDWPSWNHVDFLYAKDASLYFYEPAINLMRAH